MLPLQHTRRWLAASVLMLVFVLIAAMMPAVWFFDSKVAALSWFENVDKWLHGITFMVLAAWFTGMYRRHSYWRIALGLLAFGLMIEVCQRMVSYRSADFYDLMADAGGIIAGLLIGIAGLGGWCMRLENRLVARARRD
ncbi:MAG: VanZ family protein [Gammaproteobacteria bacterium]|nr:VanZ family protein [Gammaproteobacteria bacterium]